MYRPIFECFNVVMYYREKIRHLWQTNFHSFIHSIELLCMNLLFCVVFVYEWMLNSNLRILIQHYVYLLLYGFGVLYLQIIFIESPIWFAYIHSLQCIVIIVVILCRSIVFLAIVNRCARSLFLNEFYSAFYLIK